MYLCDQVFVFLSIGRADIINTRTYLDQTSKNSPSTEFRKYTLQWLLLSHNQISSIHRISRLACRAEDGIGFIILWLYRMMRSTMMMSRRLFSKKTHHFKLTFDTSVRSSRFFSSSEDSSPTFQKFAVRYDFDRRPTDVRSISISLYMFEWFLLYIYIYVFVFVLGYCIIHSNVDHDAKVKKIEKKKRRFLSSRFSSLS